MKKKYLLVIVIIIALILLTLFAIYFIDQHVLRYSAKSTPSETYTKITQTLSLPDMQVIDNATEIFQQYNIDASNILTYSYAESTETNRAETIAILETNSKSSAQKVAKSLENLKNDIANKYKDTEPFQYAVAINGSISIKENFVFFVIASDANVIKDVINANI